MEKLKKAAGAATKKAFDWGVVLRDTIKSIATSNMASNITRGVLMILTIGIYFWYSRWKKKQAKEKTKETQAKEQAQVAEQARQDARDTRSDADAIDDEFGE